MNAYEKIKSRLQTLHASLTINLIQCALEVDHKHPIEFLPDYLGQAYFNLTRDCYWAAAQGDEAKFKRLFSLYSPTYYAVSNRLRPKKTSPWTEYETALSLQPIRDAMELSGYAILYSVIHQKDFWSPVKNAWDNYFSKSNEPIRPLAYMALALQHYQAPFAIKPGDMHHTARGQDFIRRVTARGWAREISSHWRDRQTDQDKIPSLIRVLGVGSFMYYHPEDVFATMYLFSYSDAFKLRWPNKAIELFKALHREVVGEPPEVSDNEE